MKKEIIKGILPCFHGFYETIHTIDEDGILENINYDREEKKLPELDHTTFYDHANFDYKKFHNDYSISAVETIGKELTGYIKSVTFEGLYSPREYNFSTDEIQVIYEISEDNKKKILEFILDNLVDFEQYIKENFTNRSGFSSFYSNDFHEWLNNFKQWDFKDIETQFSVYLEFIMAYSYDSNNLQFEINEQFFMNNCSDDYLINYEEMLK